MLMLFDVVTKIFFKPSVGMQEIDKISLKTTICFYFALIALTFYPVVRFLYPSFGYDSILVLFICKFVLSLAFFILIAFFINGWANFLYNANAKIKDLFKGLMFSCLPFSLLPVLITLPVIGNKVFLLMVVLLFWSNCIFSLLMRKLYNFNMVQVTFLIVIPWMFIIIFLFVAIIYFATFIGAFFQ